MCVAAARRAAAAHGVPVDVLIALSLTETGTRHDGVLQPWPWAVNTGGRGHWFDTRDEALSFAYRRYKARKLNFDVGCFQINFRWHGAKFSSLDAMFEPDLNADYAARFLKSHYAETGDWTLAAGRYHSMTEAHANRYRAAFRANFNRVPQVDQAAPAAVPRRPVTGGLAALNAPSGHSTPGSLVTLGDAAQPLLVQGRSLLR